LQQARDYLATLESAWQTKEPTWMQAELKLCRGRVMLHEELTPHNLLRAQTLLEEILSSESALPGQRELASESLVVLLAARGETKAALARLPSGSSKDSLQRLQDNLGQLQSRVEKDRQPAVVEVRLAVVQALARQAPSPNLRREEAQCLVTLGRSEQARPLLAELDQQLAQDPAFTLEHAQALQAMGTRADYQRATELYRRLERLSKPGSDSWLEARYQLAACLAELGEKKRARSILRVTARAWLDQDAEGIEPDRRQTYARRFQELEARVAR
jgi:thioredoxin-like negative regulator of GroEL